MCAHQSEAATGSADLVTTRLVLRPIRDEDVAAVVAGRRLPHWANDFPRGDREIAGLLAQAGMPSGADRAFGHRAVVERSTGDVIGGVGFFGPPTAGVVEIGYGIVESRRNQGCATEAVRAMIHFALGHPEVAQVKASVEAANVASVRVLQKVGMVLAAHDGAELRFVIGAP